MVPSKDPGEFEIPESFRSALRSFADRSERLGLHAREVRAGAGRQGAIALVDFVVGDLAFSPAVQADQTVEDDRSLRSMEQSIADDEFAAACRRIRLRRRDR